jgi:hypothetical protein
MNKVKDQPLPSYSPASTQQTTKGNKRLWAFALLAGMLVFTVNFRGVLKATTWKPCAGFRKGSLHTKPRSHFTLPSGDTIPSVALGESAPDIVSLTSHFILIYAPGVWQAGGRELGEAVKTALAAGYRHFDGAWAYRVRTLTDLG